MAGDSWKFGVAEIVAIMSLAGSILIGGYVIGVGLADVRGEVKTLNVKVDANTQSIHLVKEQAKEDQNQVLEQVREVKEGMETIRVESKADRQRIIDQLQRISPR